MSFFGRTEICLHTKVDLNISTREPDATTLCEFGRLRDLDHAQQVSVEMPRDIFAAGRHGELNMIDENERKSRHANILVCAAGRCSSSYAC